MSFSSCSRDQSEGTSRDRLGKGAAAYRVFSDRNVPAPQGEPKPLSTGPRRPHLVRLHSRVFGDDPCATARSVQKHPIKAAHHLWRRQSRPYACCKQHSCFPGTAQPSTATKGRVTRRSVRRTRAHLGELAPIIVADDGVGDSQAVQVAHDTLEPLCIGVIGKDHTRVLHQLSYGGRGSAGLSSIQTPRAKPIPSRPAPLCPASQYQVPPRDIC